MSNLFSTMLLMSFVPMAVPQTSAEDLYKGMKKQLAAAKGLTVRYSGTHSQREPPTNFKGQFAVAPVNKLRATLEITRQKEAKVNATLVCDGKVFDAVSTRYTVPDDFGSQFLDVFAFHGLWTPLGKATSGVNLENGRSDLYLVVPVSQYKLGAKEKVGDREAQRISFTLFDPKLGIRVDLWLDVKTQLPLKRLISLKNEVHIEEHYSDWNLNPTFKDDHFQVPKK